MTPANIRDVADRLDAIFDMPTHIALLFALADLVEAAEASTDTDRPCLPADEHLIVALARVKGLKP